MLFLPTRSTHHRLLVLACWRLCLSSSSFWVHQLLKYDNNNAAATTTSSTPCPAPRSTFGLVMATDSLVLTEGLTKIVLVAAELSALAYHDGKVDNSHQNEEEGEEEEEMEPSSTRVPNSNFLNRSSTTTTTGSSTINHRNSNTSTTTNNQKNSTSIRSSIIVSSQKKTSSIIVPFYDHLETYKSQDPNDPSIAQAWTASKNGYCYVAFGRGSITTSSSSSENMRGMNHLDWSDWQRIASEGDEAICISTSSSTTTNEDHESNGSSNSNNQHCCTTRETFLSSYQDADYRIELEKNIRHCAMNCMNLNECVVFTGHGIGGAIAAIVAILFTDLNPYVITFGQPPTIDIPCPIITSSRWYRFINTRKPDPHGGLTYDPIPFIRSNLDSYRFGHMILLSDDTTGVAYMGLDTQQSFGPLDVSQYDGNEIMLSHSMITTATTTTKLSGKNRTKGNVIHTNPGYLDRIHALVKSYEKMTYPIRPSGYRNGYPCTQSVECESDTCTIISSPKNVYGSFVLSHQCTSKQHPCTTDADCASDLLQCRNSTTITTATTTKTTNSKKSMDGQCLPKLSSCMTCTMDSDCLYGQCKSAGGILDLRCTGGSGHSTTITTSSNNNNNTSTTSTGSFVFLLDDNCPCQVPSQCTSGRCHGYKPRICTAQMAIGASCNSNSDCQSGHCSWTFRCEANSTGTNSEDLNIDFGSTATTHYKSNNVQSSYNKENVQSSFNKGGHTKKQLGDSTKARRSNLWHVFGLVVGILALLVGAMITMIRLNRIRHRYGYEQIPSQIIV